MSQSEDTNNNKDVEETIRVLVRTLFEAENGQCEELADGILAQDYLPIIRAKGQVDKNRACTLKKIAKGRKGFVRDIKDKNIEVALFLNDQVAIARTELPTTDTERGAESYRNMHVFLKRDNQWKCVAWQVTQILSVPPDTDCP